jgi:type I restriction enzyme R subunit
MEVAWGMLHGLDYSDFRMNALKPMRAAADHILGLEDGKKRFADCVLPMTQAFALCCSCSLRRSIGRRLRSFKPCEPF